MPAAVHRQARLAVRRFESSNHYLDTRYAL
jgi:hypothetical protein